MVAKKNINRPDYALLVVIGLLLTSGILILASVSASYSQARFGNSYYFLRRQIIVGLLPGLLLGFLAFKVKLSFIKKYSPFLLLLNLALLAMVFVPGIGLKTEGASRWINLGLISFQPSEFLKITFILYLAAWLTGRSQKEKVLNKSFIFFLVILGLIALTLIFQPDISTLAVIFAIAVIMYFSIKTPLFHTVLILLMGAGSLFFLIKQAPYRLARFSVFLRPGYEPMGIGYQLQQAVIAIGSGGIRGTGLGMSVQKFFIGLLPQPISDSIFVIFSEETGFIGGVFLVLLFLFFLWRGFKIAKGSKNKFCQLAALGITSWIIIQTFVNIGAMIRLLPLTGIPLPFVSYGGSSLVATLIAMGILLNISKKSNFSLKE